MLNAELEQAWLKGWEDVVELVTQLAQQDGAAMRGEHEIQTGKKRKAQEIQESSGLSDGVAI